MLFEEFQLWRPPWTSERNDFSNSESLCHCDASYPISAQSNLRFGRCLLKNLKTAAISEQKDFSNSESLCRSDASHKFWLNLTYGLGGDVI